MSTPTTNEPFYRGVNLCFIARKFNLEVSEVELRGAGLPITQEAADKWAAQQMRGSAYERRQRQLDGCYKGRRKA